MAAGTSVAEKLLNALKMPKLCPMPSYISEANSVSIDDFMQSRYAHDYVLDTSNIHWGGKLNSNHVFDIYAGYHSSRDSNKVQLEIVEYVTINSQRYAWDCYTLLCMSRLSLSDWRAKMTFWANPADTMTIYALSDQYSLHTSIITKSKLWTTVTPDFQGIEWDVLETSAIKLLYMVQTDSVVSGKRQYQTSQVSMALTLTINPCCQIIQYPVLMMWKQPVPLCKSEITYPPTFMTWMYPIPQCLKAQKFQSVMMPWIRLLAGWMCVCGNLLTV